MGLFDPLRERIAIIKAQKENMPSYQRRLIYGFIWPSLAVFIFLTIAVVIVCSVLEVRYGEDILVVEIPAIVLCSLVVAWAIGVLVAWIFIRKRLIRDKAAELEKFFCPMPIEEAEKALKESGVINDEGFLCAKEEEAKYGSSTPSVGPEQKVCPFENSSIAIFASYAVCKLQIIAVVFDGEQDINGGELTNELYNFIIEKNIKIENREFFDMIVNDKQKFVKLVTKTQIRL